MSSICYSRKAQNTKERLAIAKRCVAIAQPMTPVQLTILCSIAAVIAFAFCITL